MHQIPSFAALASVAGTCAVFLLVGLVAAAAVEIIAGAMSVLMGGDQ